VKDKVYKGIKPQIIKSTIEPNMHLSEAEISDALNIRRAPRKNEL